MISANDRKRLEVELFARGDTKAIVMSADLFVKKMASDFGRRYSLTLDDVEDLVCEGRMGVLHAIRKFDPKRDVVFLSYASWWIKAFIRQWIERNSHIVRMPESTRRKRTKKGLVPAASSWEGAVHLGLVKGKSDVSLDEALFEDSDFSLIDSLTDDALNPEERLSLSDARAILFRAMKGLSVRDRRVLNDRARGKTLGQIGEHIGVTRERVRQLEKKAIRKLRVILKSTAFRDHR